MRICKYLTSFSVHAKINRKRYNDCLEEELAKELENGRLVRLLCKLGFINERPE